MGPDSKRHSRNNFSSDFTGHNFNFDYATIRERSTCNALVSICLSVTSQQFYQNDSTSTYRRAKQLLYAGTARFSAAKDSMKFR